MEKHLGRDLTRDEVVHHIDEDIHNNDINNLQVMTVSEHRKYHMKGSKNPMYGRKHSDETRKKLSEAAKNRAPMAEETKKKISKANTGKKHTDEAKRKISESQKARWRRKK